MKNLIAFDCEVFKNYFLVAFKNIDNDKIIFIETKGKDSCLDDDQRKKLYRIITTRTIFGFNSRNYDIPIILHALKSKSCLDIYTLSKSIVDNETSTYKTMENFNLALPEKLKHFDIQEPAPGVKVGLKLYGGRLHSNCIQDLPFDPNAYLSNEDAERVKTYCINDLDLTIDLYRNIKDRIDLRVDMSKKYNKDLLSKSDAQIAEIILKSQLQKKTGRKNLSPPKLSKDFTFQYDVPDFIHFENVELKKTLDIIRNCRFKINSKGYTELPEEIKNLKIKVGHSTYTLGKGGVHSNEKKQTVVPGDNNLLIDKDVVSYYPNIILNQRLFPKHLGKSFLTIYEDIVKTRLDAKRKNNKVVNDSLKIVINGIFGKFGSKFSFLYAPELIVAVTLTGQLSLLMLIERLEKHGINVISANTDGFVSLINKNQYEIYDSLCFDWELSTGFELEETKYKALYSRDVNNYLAVFENDNVKKKGIFAVDSLTKNPQASICVTAVCDFLISGKPIDKTIRNCSDLTKFLYVRSVSGGAVFREEYLGRVVRWIYSTKGDIIKYKKNGNKVPKTDGARPVIGLDLFPDNIDYDRYINESMSMLNDLGIDGRCYNQNL